MSATYVLDTNSFRVFGNYYPESFPSFWDQIEKLVADGMLVSCREVAKELELQSPTEHLNAWVDGHPDLFFDPTEEEMEYVAQIFRVPHFRQLIGQKQQLKGLPVADPFLVARGAIQGASVVTEETLKPNAAKVPNVCEHFGVRSTNVQGFLVEVGWRF
jgi:hypothetical protein